MKREFYKIISMILAIFFVMPQTIIVSAQDGTAHNCDFMQLVQNNSDTYYGNYDDIIVLDEYTTAYLTYSGTYVSADGKVFLRGGAICNNDGRYKQGSYIEFKPPYDGTVSLTSSDIGWFENEKYMGYNINSPITVTSGNTYYFGYRKDSSYISSLTYTPSEITEPLPTPVQNPDSIYYQSPSTTWDFEQEVMETGDNTPVLEGYAIWNNREIQFPADNTQTGAISINMSDPIKNNIIVEFDVEGHSKALGGQYFNFSVSNSEEKVIDFQVHPYSSDDIYNAKGLYICGDTAADAELVNNAWTAVGTTHIKAEIDYNTRKATVVIGSDSFTADIPEGTVKDFVKFSAGVSRSKTSAERYISLDNLTISEFDSQGESALVTVADGYEEQNIAGYSCRVKAEQGKPAVIYLASELRLGTDNISQLYDAKFIFDKLDGKASLIAPQSNTVFTDVTDLVREAREQYNASSVAVIGQSESVSAALGSGADRIMAIAGSGTQTPNADIWIFSGYNDNITPVSDIKTMVNRLQTSGVNTRYTEYPFAEHKLSDKIADEIGVAEWLINDNSDKKVVDLVLFAGQSNMAGRGDYAESIVCPAGYGYEYHAVTEPGVLSAVTEPFGKYENNDNINDNSGGGEDRRSGDMVAALMNAYFSQSGVPIVGVQASRGGQATDYFLTDNVMSEMQSRYNEAKEYLEESGYIIRKKFLVWCQGESDADKGRSDEAYKSNTLSIFNTLKEQTGIEDMFIVRTGHYNINYGLSEEEIPDDTVLAKDAEYGRISNAQQELADENSNIYIASSFYSDECLENMRDQYHYYQNIYNSVGTMAGENIAEIYKDEIIPTPAPPTATDKPGISYSWDFETDQTAQSGNNIPVISGTAQYDEQNKNIKLDSQTSTDGEIKINLEPKAEGIITAEFDFKFAKLSNLNHVISISDSEGNDIINVTADIYNGTGTVSICGKTVAADNEFIKYINNYRGDGMNADTTHFKIEINYAKGTVQLNIVKNADETGSFTGILDQELPGDAKEFSIKSIHNKYADGRASYVDNISIESYIPGTAMYVTGSLNISKRMGMAVEEKYTISKTYTDETEKVEWYVSGVNGVSIDKETGVLRVEESAGTGTAVIKAVLVQSKTLLVGTEAYMEVAVNDFAKVSDYSISGASTIELGKESDIILQSVIDEEGNDITEFAELTDFESDNPDIAKVTSAGKIIPQNAGTAVISAKINIKKMDEVILVNIPVKTGIYEITSSDTEIDVSGLISYGTNNFRVYNQNGEYVITEAVNGKIQNPSGTKVTVVCEYSFDLTSSGNGVVEYSKETGFGLIQDLNYNINDNGCMPVSGRPVMVDIPEGFYDITVLRTGGVRCDVYSNGIQIINNTTSSGSQNRPSGSGAMFAPRIRVDSGNLNLTFGNTSGSNERITNITIAKVPEQFKKTVIWIAGDSEAANYYPINSEGDDLESSKIMMTGFGMQLDKYLDNNYQIANFGQPSATVKTWYEECFESVIENVEPGDVMLIDFGINDAVSSSNKITLDEMKVYMSKMINALKSKNAYPVLISPVYNNKYQAKSYFTYSNQTNDMYEFAYENEIPCIDLNKGTQMYVNQAVEETGDDNWIANNYHVNDNLHLTQHSALMVAAIIAGGLSEIGIKTNDYSYTYKDVANISDSQRGEETGVNRIYSVDELKNYVTVSGITAPIPAPSQNPQESNMPAFMSYDGKVITIKSKDDNLKTAILAEVLYQEDKTLEYVKIHDIQFQNNSASLELESQIGTVFYLWNSISDMIAAAKPIKYTKPEESEEPIVSASPQPTPTEQPEQGEILYWQDFEGYSEGSSGGWESYAGTVEVKNDTADGMGKYMTVVSGKSGTCRSGLTELPQAIDKNFVFECDFKSSYYDNVSELQLVEKKSSIYMNHGVYSNAYYALTLDRPRSSNIYIINNGKSDSGLSVSSYNTPIVSTKEIQGDPWLHVKAVGNFDTHTIMIYITSLDGEIEYYHGMADMSPELNSWKCIHMLSPSTGAYTCIDNIKISEATEQDLSPKYHKVKISCPAYSFEQYVLDGDSVINIPDISMYGEYFEGWKMSGDNKLYSSRELEKTAIVSDCEITGVISPEYIEPMSKIEFSLFPAGNELVMGEDENTYGDNIISLSIEGEQGTSLVTNPDDRVNDYSIEWSFDGFRILDGKPTDESGSVYCDSYALCEITEKAQSSVNFKLKRTAANYYGLVTAKVTYNGKTLEVSNPLLIMGDKSSSSDILLPARGYTADYNKYDSALSGYTFIDSDTIFGNWRSDGSDNRKYVFMSDETGNFLRLVRDAVGNSVYGYNDIGTINSQTIFKQDVRFNVEGNIQYTGGSSRSISDIAFTLSMSEGRFKFNGTDICAGNRGEWYHIEISADPTTKKTWAKIYDSNGGELLGQSQIVDFEDMNYISGRYYRINPAKEKNGSIDFNNVIIEKAKISQINITAPEIIDIPEDGQVVADLSVSAVIDDGSKALGQSSWTIDDEFAEGVSICSIDANTAKLTVDSSASSGDMKFTVSIGGERKSFIIKLLGTRDNVAFISAKSGVMIPMDGEAEYNYQAVVRNGQAEDIPERSVLYELYDSDNVSPVQIDGISIDKSSGILTVDSGVKPQIIYIHANSSDSFGNEISRFVKVNVYNLNFDLLSETEGFTYVNNVSYTDSLGYGVDKKVSDTEYTFKVKLERGRVYNIKAVYKGTIKCEEIAGFSDGFERSLADIGEDEYSVAVFGDDIMDIAVYGQLKSIQIVPVTKSEQMLPDWWTIGDSTVQQNGSWGYTIASSETSELSKYPELDAVINTFHNSGRAGRQHKSYYSEGLMNDLLCKMNPGDIVSISGMGTNDTSSTYEQFKMYNEIYMNAVIDMGGYVILGSYTPTGNYGSTSGKVYDYDTMTFKGMRTESYDRAIREVYAETQNNPKVIGFLDIGKIADEKMTKDVRMVYAAELVNGEAYARAAADKKAEEMMAWWKDYNHYYAEFSNYILPDITCAAAELIKSIK